MIAGPLITVLEHAWAAIRTQHPDGPPAVLITGSGLDAGRDRVQAVVLAYESGVVTAGS